TTVIQRKDHPYAQRALLQRAALYEQAGRRDEAAVDYAAYAQRFGQNPQAVEAGRRAIDLAFGNRKFAEVVELARPWLKNKAGAPAIRHGVQLKLAVSLIKLGHNEQALAELAALLADKPGADLLTLGEYYRGLLLAGDAKQGDAAIRSLESALRGKLASEQVVEGTALIARLHRMAGRDDAAVKMYLKLRDLAPDRPIPTVNRLWVGRSLYESGNTQAALVWLSGVLADQQASSAVLSEALFLTARCHHDSGASKQAVETYQRLVAFSAGYVDQGRLGLAQALAAMGKVDSALIEYDGLLQVRGSEVKATALLESAGLQADLAARYRKAGNVQAAETQWKEALNRLKRVTLLHDLPELEPVVLRALMMLGQIARERGDVERARLHYQRITKRSGNTAWHEAGKAEFHLLDGRRGDAIVVLRRLASGGSDRLVVTHARRRLEQLGEKP
ncbi:MAG: tetratricopeptide repeat protein, partial [Phycisphaerae bacterium]|nr:tetratricopeptide repeat protein [Phycisphaerae bacterium]